MYHSSAVGWDFNNFNMLNIREKGCIRNFIFLVSLNHSYDSDNYLENRKARYDNQKNNLYGLLLVIYQKCEEY
jgi:hypothetical protein